MTNTLLNSEAMASVGQERPLRTGAITANDIQKFCVAVDDRNPAWLKDGIAPPLFPQCATRPAPFEDELLADGQYRDLAPPGLRHLQSLLGGQEFDFIRPARVGEQVVERVSIASIQERQGRNGPLVFVMEEANLSSVSGDPILRSRNQLILRPAPPRQPATEVMEETGGGTDASAKRTEWTGGRMIKRPSLLSLFMFDATIWATHRIHWDAAQARSEGLPAPVLPGWMMAAYISEFAQAQAPQGMRLAGIALQYKAFAFAGNELTCARTDSGAGDCMVSLSNARGQEIISGTARFTA